LKDISKTKQMVGPLMGVYREMREKLMRGGWRDDRCDLDVLTLVPLKIITNEDTFLQRL
jgi:hypothetical protein